ncbi:glutamamyl carboxypeptidase putative metallo-peptidase Clan MH Family M18 [Leptomonas seymouri]|uniref:Glutamamyl carboxypeptidase putative metallo-peptidase Clan MH Family M18 n=1 Tax=Leptomonas seymouri TaxID=5684 RepID=A0A0N1IHB5_LEPSE|nr:glutamamyl carboxypeptidase putative metallo-peptidase Clan MH Family M18 [Leptomonas seymouri]|eukprot:KPI82842.1 glutamamyl carboxypeptidase putative metallo-peptidase Clan MH Family M18 [Leptomonas seymouri]
MNCTLPLFTVDLCLLFNRTSRCSRWGYVFLPLAGVQRHEARLPQLQKGRALGFPHFLRCADVSAVVFFHAIVLNQFAMLPHSSTHEEWLSRLIGFVITCRKSNMKLAHYVETYSKSVALPSTLVCKPEKSKARLLAMFPAANAATHGAIVLSGHTDAVKVDDQT